MAGHSQFKNIMYRKGAQDAKRAKVFTKLIRELTVAARISPDVENNARLRTAIIAARTANMPKDTMDRAIKRGAGGEDTTDYQEIRYEGYGSGGVAVIVEALTDNRNRTAAEVRSFFNKYGGALGETNSVSFQFDHVGHLRFEKGPKLTFDALFEEALGVGAEDVLEDEEGFDVYTPMAAMLNARETLAKIFGEPKSAQLMWRPQNMVPVDEKQLESLMKLIQALEENDDVQNVYANFDVDPALLEKMGA